MVKGWATFAHRFEQHYQNFTPWLPPRLRTREWMFIPFGGGTPRRHIRLTDANEIKRKLVSRPPHSVFYSTAYWRDSSIRSSMKEKGWMGADLIFDLDGDHLPGIVDTDFIGMLEVIREQAWKLWNDFLQPEFGFEEKFLHLTFSGHRGFHLHYRDPQLVHLDGEARRELVSHIRGEGVDVMSLLPRSEEENASGWAKRLRGGVQQTIERLDKVRNEEGEEARVIVESCVDAMKRSAKLKGVKRSKGKKAVLDLAQLIEHPRRRKELIGGNLNALGGTKSDSNYFRDAFTDILRSDSSVVLGSAGETDEVVTIDCHRVIRHPTSLHGKCGLQVTEFPLSRLDPDGSQPFDPLTEAVVLPMDGKMNVQIIAEEINTRVKDCHIEGHFGDKLELPEAAAAFVVLKGWGEVIRL